MKYRFECDGCDVERAVESNDFEPPKGVLCIECGNPMDRIFGCRMNLSGCRDADYVPPEHRVPLGPHDLTPGQAEAIEQRYQEDIHRKRQAAGRDNRMKYSVPAPLYHGKIRETGDKHYWKDEQNLARHKSCEIRRQK